VKRAEAGAAAHVAGQAIFEANAVCAFVVKKAAAQKQVAGGADGRCRTCGTHQRTVFVVKVDAVRIERTLAHQAKVVVHREVAARMGKQLARPFDFVLVLGHMRLDPHAGVLRGQLARTAQLRFGAAGCKAGRDGVAQAVFAVPLVDQ
jgi:hypothetical protein